MKKEKAFETVIVLALATLVFFLLFDKKWLIYLAIVLLTTPIVSVKTALFISKIWFAFSNYLGLTMNFLLMFICFYLFLVPLSFLQQLFGGNQILKKKEGNSYFHKRNHLFTSKDIKRPW